MQVELNDVFSVFENQLRNTLYTSTVASVINVDNYSSDGVVDVQVMINRTLQSGKSIPGQIRYGVPVQLVGGGGAVATFPLQVGDEVLLIFAMRSIDEWVESVEGSVTPRDLRVSQGTDCFAIPCIFRSANSPNPDPNDVVIRYGDASIRLKEDGNVQSTTGASFSLKNEEEELIQVLTDALTAVSNITVNTMYGPSPINNKAEVTEILERLQTFLE